MTLSKTDPSPISSEVVVQFIADTKYYHNGQSTDFNRPPEMIPLKVPLFIKYGGGRSPKRSEAAVWPAESPSLEYFRSKPKMFRIIPTEA